MRFEDSVAHAWLQQAAAAAIVVDGDAIQHEAQANLWAFSPREDQAAGVDVASVVRCVEAVADDRQATLRAQGAPSMIFYCWHDGQARQLRFSLVSAAHGRLPFGVPIQQTSLPALIARIVQTDWFNPQWGAADVDDDAMPASAALPVYMRTLHPGV
ncbi:hypothetical protein [Xanthomonas sp. CFBP 8445]|uniref:hypothetical protein n=1 Tax=Xanthomonas sp. CFBP 8445 TaxID=2971236 RepID=UPI0021E0FA60|nr:hypothetical protein [Xanthomonas sp. CFBP 8445]UYC10449.1 hypothetical protein NUG21_11630 [Xanthomonas sp. CFBP 8445]